MNAGYSTSRGYLFAVSWRLVLLLGCSGTLPFLSADAQPGAETIAVTACMGLLFCFTGLCVWGLLAALKHKLRVSDAAVEACWPGETRRVVLDEVHEARWGCFGDARTLTLDAQPEKLKIDFRFYGRQARRNLIRFFHLRIPEARQRNWDRFWAASWRLCDEPGPRDGEWLAARARLRLRLCTIYYLSAVVLVPLGVIVWWWTRHGWVLALLALLLPLWPVCHFAVPTRGKVARLRRPSREAARIAEHEYLENPGRREKTPRKSGLDACAG